MPHCRYVKSPPLFCVRCDRALITHSHSLRGWMSLPVNAHMADGWRGRCQKHKNTQTKTFHTHITYHIPAYDHTSQGFLLFYVSHHTCERFFHTFLSVLLDLFFLPLAELQSDWASRLRHALAIAPWFIHQPASVCTAPKPHAHSVVHAVPKGSHIHTNANGQTPHNISTLLLSQQQSIDHVTAVLGLGCLHFISSAGERALHTPYAITHTHRLSLLKPPRANTCICEDTQFNIRSKQNPIHVTVFVFFVKWHCHNCLTFVLFHACMPFFWNTKEDMLNNISLFFI